MSYGPALPPGFKPEKQTNQDEKDESRYDSKTRSQYGPTLPLGLSKSSDSECCNKSSHSYGPSLPSSSSKRAKLDSGESSDSSSDSSDSASENDRGKSDKIRVIGPCLSSVHSKDTDCAIGPFLPTAITIGKRASHDSEEEDVYGPLPCKSGDDVKYSAVEDFERRAQRMKRKLEGNDNLDEGPAKRDAWMTELPDVLGQAFSGTTARKFRSNAAPEISDAARSEWTDTPADKERKEKEAAEGKHKHRKKKHEHKETSKRDKYMREQIEEYNKKANRSKSLLEMHQKKLKKEKKKKKKKGEKEKVERRPFDRETDLQTNVFDDAKRKSLIKRAANLGGRFGHGGVEFL